MTPMFKGFLWIVFIVALFGVSVKVKAQDDAVRTLMEGQERVYTGTCVVDRNGLIAKEKDDRNTVAFCVLARNTKDDTDHRIIIYNDDKTYNRIIRFDTKTGKQEVIWRAGRSA